MVTCFGSALYSAKNPSCFHVTDTVDTGSYTELRHPAFTI